MKRLILSMTASVALVGLIAAAPLPGRAQSAHQELDAVIKDYLATHPDEVGEIVKGYLIKHPEALREVIAELIKHRPQAKAAQNADAKSPDRSAAIRSNAQLLFESTRQVTIGNPSGDVTLVEFFDYNCGYCKRALADTLALIDGDPKLKIVLKELPILGPGSGEAARVAVAVHMQDPGGSKYLAFHRKLLGGPGPVNSEKALAAASEQGLDMSRLAQDMASDEVGATLEENIKLAKALGINGTPGYVVGDTVVPGAVGAAALRSQIESARAHPG